MPRKPNYDFERRERQKAKAASAVEKAEAKSRKKLEGQPPDAAAPAPKEDQGS